MTLTNLMYLLIKNYNYQIINCSAIQRTSSGNSIDVNGAATGVGVELAHLIKNIPRLLAAGFNGNFLFFLCLSLISTYHQRSHLRSSCNGVLLSVT